MVKIIIWVEPATFDEIHQNTFDFYVNENWHNKEIGKMRNQMILKQCCFR